MPFLGCAPSAFCARARYRTLPLAMFCMACAWPVSASMVIPTSGAEPQIRNARELIVALRSEDPSVQRRAKAALRQADPEIVRALLVYGKTPGQHEMGQKVVALMQGKAVPALFGALGEAALAGPAGSVLFRVLGPADAARIPELLRCAQDLPAARNYCSQSLVQVSGPKAAAHAAALAKALSVEDPLLRASAAAALGRIGRGAAVAAPALRRALKDPVPAVRAQAKAALRRVGA